MLWREIKQKLNNFAQIFSFPLPYGVEEPANQPPPPYGVEEPVKRPPPLRVMDQPVQPARPPHGVKELVKHPPPPYKVYEVANFTARNSAKIK